MQSVHKLEDDIEAFFAKNGPLSSLEGYHPRSIQIEMAQRIGALLLGHDVVTIEAGCGTGKSFAYLVPALLSEKKVIVSTATKALQDQLFQKDLPIVLDAIYRYSGVRKKVTLMKGRSNYICLRKLDEEARSLFLFQSDREELEQLTLWAKRSETGERSEVNGLREDSALFAKLDARTEHCIGNSCAFYTDCFVTQVRKRAQEADVTVVNHALLCADRSLRSKLFDTSTLGESPDGFGHILPEADAWIIDEAHALPDIATRHFGVSVSQKEIATLIADLTAVAHNHGDDFATAILSATPELVPSFLGVLSDFSQKANMFQSSHLKALQQNLNQIEVALMARLQDNSDAVGDLKPLERRVHKMTLSLMFTLLGGAEKSGFVPLIENDSRGAVLTAWPIDPSEILKNCLWSAQVPTLLTSATLAFNASLYAFSRQVGVSNSEQDQIFPPLFDYANRSALYVPATLPLPNEPDFLQATHDELEYLIRLFNGGTLALFTSHRALNEAYFALKARLLPKEFLLLKQGDAPKLDLIRQFREQDAKGAGVLLATHSFWEGVDIKGKALRSVVIDRLPFQPPDDPFYEARMKHFEAEGLSPFRDVAVPAAALSLKQGIGRLLRTHEDAGVVTLLDRRIVNKSYGRLFMKTLPPMPQISTREALAHRWRQHLQPLLEELPT